MKLNKKNTALILVDIQKAFDDEEYWGGNRNNKDAEQNCKLILEKWRELSLPIFHVRHSSRNTNSKLHSSHVGFEFKDEVKPIDNEPIITKDVNSAFIGTDLKERIDTKGITTLVIIGLTTNHCISTTVRMAANFDYETILISDATATFDRVGINGERYSSEIIHNTTLANLKDEFATIMDTNQVLANL